MKFQIFFYNHIEILNFQTSVNKIKLIIKVNHFLNLIKALENNNYIRGGNGVQKKIVNWIWDNFEFSKPHGFNYIYNKYTDQTGRSIKGFENIHNSFFDTIIKELKKIKKDC